MSDRKRATEGYPRWWQPLWWREWRLELHPIGQSDAQMVSDALTEDVAYWLGFESLEDMRSGTPVWAWESAGLALSRRTYRYSIYRDASFSGVIEIRPDPLDGHIGYWLAPQARARGTMTLANRVALVVAFDGLELDAVEWTADAKNVASIAVMKRLGAEPVSRSRVTGRGKRTAEVRYRLLRGQLSNNDDWPKTLSALFVR